MQARETNLFQNFHVFKQNKLFTKHRKNSNIKRDFTFIATNFYNLLKYS